MRAHRKINSFSPGSIRASIDLGTNTCLLLILQISSPNGLAEKTLEDRCEMVRLGEGIDAKGVFSPEAMQRTRHALARHEVLLQSYSISPQEVVCVATSQARGAKNAKDFFSEIQKKHGFSFRILSGEEESSYTFLGIARNSKNTVVLDIGGGSTEIQSLEAGKSMEIGSVRLTERFFKSDPVTLSEKNACQRLIRETLMHEINSMGLGMNGNLHHKKWIAVAGTATTLAHCVVQESDPDAPFDANRINGFILKKSVVETYLKRFSSQTISERMHVFSLHPLRADSILAGTLILWEVLDLFQLSSIEVSTRGLRYGVLFS